MGKYIVGNVSGKVKLILSGGIAYNKGEAVSNGSIVDIDPRKAKRLIGQGVLVKKETKE